MEPEMQLIGAVIKTALADADEGLDTAAWLAGPCGNWWLTLGGVDPEAAWSMAGHKKDGRHYAKRGTCVCGATGSDLIHMREA
jgi:hypothetical protein